MNAQESRPGSGPGVFAALPLGPLRGWQKAALAAAVAGILVLVGFLAAELHPESGAPKGTALELRIAQVFAAPSQTEQDSRLTGDLLVERFYVLDLGTGERYVADFLKGRIEGLETVPRDGGSTMQMVLLDLRNLKRDRALYSAFVREVAPPDPAAGFYVGLVPAGGRDDAFPLNYDGSLPGAHQVFVGLEGEDAGDFLLKQDFKDATAAPRLVTVSGYNFLLSTSDVFALFRSEFGLEKTIFMSELLIVDTTASGNRKELYRFYSQFPQAPPR